MSDVITFEIGLPKSESHDVVGGKLTITRDPAEHLLAEEEIEVLLGTNVVQFEAIQDSQVGLSYVVIDDGGNLSIPVEAAFTASDTFAPLLAGELTITAVGEAAAPIDESPDMVSAEGAAAPESPAAVEEAGPEEAGEVTTEEAVGEPDEEKPTPQEPTNTQPESN